jgi:GntR family transcriptional repressor for pyruvate dehydrogenase complex
MFKTATRNRVFQDVVDQIQEAILTGRLTAGDILPAERELKEMFQTSRGTLREALRVLEQKGLIEIKLGVGGGAVVKAPGTQQVCESLDLLIRFQKVSLAHIAEFREKVEGDVAALAAQRAQSNDIAHLRTLLFAARQAVGRGPDHWEDFVREDQRIHLALAHISGNPVFVSVLKTVHENIRSYFEQFLPKDKDVLAQDYQDLCDIVDAVACADAAAAGKLARNHVRRFNRFMEGGQPVSENDGR